ncbi:hypothetical protein [Sulfuricurvum sp.]|uniref:hypothetical protein n=1 Tax=Sulfuricurvum sp. TaxID=2025608 RepID=UPI002E33DCD9|nr:hypothetical protein [Sulfuricurvum sp.]HEX5329882.1 hypothetical protein [Sulfuricurvum sp.]
MKKIFHLALVVGTMCSVASASNFDIGVSGSENGIDGFSFSIGDYYHVPHQEVVVIERTIPRDEMSVVYFLARESRRDARYITDLRSRGGNWWDITVRLGLNPRTLYVVNSNRYHNPPYGKAYGYHKDKKHRLRDADIVELVNVRFLSEYHHITPDEVIYHRYRGEKYNRINDHYRGKKDRSYEREDRRDERREDRGSRGEKGRGNPHER